MLTTVHPPFDTRIFHKESKSLSKAGHSVTIISPLDSSSEENVDGVNIINVKRPSSKILHPITMLRVFIAGLKQDCDVYHSHEPGSLFVCALLKLVKRNKLVYDAHEHYPSLISEDRIFPNVSRKFIHTLVDVSEKLLCRFTDSIITVNYSLETRFSDIKKTTILFNVPMLNIFTLSNTVKENKRIVYAGNVNKKRGLDRLLASMPQIKKGFPDVQLLIVGKILDTKEFETWAYSYIEDHALAHNFKITGWVPHDQVVEHIQKSGIGVILFQPTYYNNIIGLPNKLFEYMACSTPVIGSDFPEIRKVIEETKCGLLVDPTNVQEITDAITWLLDHPEEAEQMGINGRHAVEEIYNWENMEKRLFKMYEDLS